MSSETCVITDDEYPSPLIYRLSFAKVGLVRRSSAEEKLSERAWVNIPFSTRLNHIEIELERELSVKC